MFGKMFRRISRGAAVDRNIELGSQTREVAIGELGVPEKFYNFVVTTRMAEIRGLAQEAREFAKIRECPLPRVLATTIYSDYQGRCAQSHQGVSIAIRELENLGITQEQIDHELARDYKAVARVGLYGS